MTRDLTDEEKLAAALGREDERRIVLEFIGKLEQTSLAKKSSEAGAGFRDALFRISRFVKSRKLKG